jgi:hypothetical protein
MAWGRLHDRANGDAKLLALSDAAWRMWGSGLIYCQAALTDGFIPEHAIHTFGVRARNKEVVAEELCRCLVPGKGPLWQRVNGGYQIHDYLDWNDSRADILAGRARGRRRVANHREKRVTETMRNTVSSALLNVADDAFSDGFEHGVRAGRNAGGNPACNAVGNAVGNALHTPTCNAVGNAIGNPVCNADGNAVGNGGSTYHVPQYVQKQERAPSAPTSSEAVENADSGPDPRIPLHRRQRSKETDDGRPKVSTIAALARDVLFRHPGEDDDGALRDLLKSACAKANLHYDGGSVGDALDRARAQVKRRGGGGG